MKGKVGEVSRDKIIEDVKCHTKEFIFYILDIWEPSKDFELKNNVIDFVFQEKSHWHSCGSLKGEMWQGSQESLN